MELKCLFITSYISTIDFTIHNHHCSRIFFSPYIFNGQNQDWGWSDDVEPSLKLVLFSLGRWNNVSESTIVVVDLDIGSVALLSHFQNSHFTEVKCEIYSCALEPRSTDSLGHQHRAKKLSPEIALHSKWSVKVKLPMYLCLLVSRSEFNAAD